LINLAKNGNKEQRKAAKAELARRGYDYQDRAIGGGVLTWGTTDSEGHITTEATEKNVAEAIQAYSSVNGTNRQAIKEWLENLGYTYDLSTGTWTRARPSLRIEGKYASSSGAYRAAAYPLSFSSEHYQWIEKDFKEGKAGWYQLSDSDGKYHWKGNIDDHLTQYGDDLSSWALEHRGDVIVGWDGEKEFALVKGNSLYAVTPAAHGSLGLPGGPALINEMGTEAVVTPYGTVTSLPSGTGVVPADITRNLWALGEVAPGISRFLEPLAKGGDSVIGDSFNVQSMIVNMNPDGTFDMDDFVRELKSAVALRRNS